MQAAMSTTLPDVGNMAVKLYLKALYLVVDTCMPGEMLYCTDISRQSARDDAGNIIMTCQRPPPQTSLTMICTAATTTFLAGTN